MMEWMKIKIERMMKERKNDERKKEYTQRERKDKKQKRCRRKEESICCIVHTSCSKNMAFMVPLDQKSMARANILIDSSFLRKKFPANITRSIPSLMAHILAMDPILFVIIVNVA